MMFGASYSEQNTFLRRVDVERRAIAVARAQHLARPHLAGLTEKAILTWLGNSPEGSREHVTASRLLEISRLSGLLADKSLQIFHGSDVDGNRRINELLVSI